MDYESFLPKGIYWSAALGNSSKNPDRIVLTFHGDPSTSRAVTWRTDRTVNESVAQISEATENSNFTVRLKDFQATTEAFDLGKYKGNNSFKVNYHSVIFKDLKPNTTYLYRVGDGKFYWSEWIQFTTAKKSTQKQNLFILVILKTMCFLNGLGSLEWRIKLHLMLHLQSMLEI